ncbi:MAG: hypothetical protein ACO4CS_03955 [bacterium]
MSLGKSSLEQYPSRHKAKVTEWREAKAPRGEPGPIYNFRRGYNVRDAGRHESADQYAAFQVWLRLQGGRTFEGVRATLSHSTATLSGWSEAYNWQKRAAAWDRDQMALTWKETEKMQRNTHKEAILEFRRSSERQAKMMSSVSEDIVKLVAKTIAIAQENGDVVPMHQVSNLLRASASLTEQSRQSWATSLGITEMLDMVEAEMQKVEVEDVTEVDAYEIPLDE